MNENDNPEDEWDEPSIGYRTIIKQTGFFTKNESIIAFIIVMIIFGLMILI